MNEEDNVDYDVSHLWYQIVGLGNSQHRNRSDKGGLHTDKAINESSPRMFASKGAVVDAFVDQEVKDGYHKQQERRCHKMPQQRSTQLGEHLPDVAEYKASAHQEFVMDKYHSHQMLL